MTAQPRLFTVPVDERRLGDAERTILESIDRTGPISANEAGQIVYRLRGYRHLTCVPRAWVTSAGGQALQKLENAGLIRRARGSRWTRAHASGVARSDLIGQYVVLTSISTHTTPKASSRCSNAGAQVDPAHAHDTPANRHFPRALRAVTSSHRSSVASRSAEIYGARRTEQLAPPLRVTRCARRDRARGVW